MRKRSAAMTVVALVVTVMATVGAIGAMDWMAGYTNATMAPTAALRLERFAAYLETYPLNESANQEFAKANVYRLLAREQSAAGNLAAAKKTVAAQWDWAQGLAAPSAKTLGRVQACQFYLAAWRQAEGQTNQALAAWLKVLETKGDAYTQAAQALGAIVHYTRNEEVRATATKAAAANLTAHKIRKLTEPQTKLIKMLVGDPAATMPWPRSGKALAAHFTQAEYKGFLKDLCGAVMADEANKEALTVPLSEYRKMATMGDVDSTK